MADDPRTELANLLAAELEAAQLRWAKAVTEFESLCNSKGRFLSGARIIGTAEKLNDGLVQYRQFIFDKWVTYVRPRLPSLPDQSAFVEVALAAMDKAIAGALGQFDARPKVSGVSTDFSGPIKEAGARERQSLESELKLYISTPTGTAASMNVNVTTHGPGSPVNVGSGTQTQQINTAEGMGELVLALTTLLDAMKDHPQLGDVREIVIEAKDEAAKPAPNKLRLRAILGGIKDGLQGTAALLPAWESVHRVMQMLGLSS
jgi:hypothetical protein